MTAAVVEADPLVAFLRAERNANIAAARRALGKAQESASDPTAAAYQLDVTRGAIHTASALQRELELLERIATEEATT